MNLKCLFGFHDWEIVESTSIVQILKGVLGEKEIKVSQGKSTGELERKVCMRKGCNRVHDTITPKIEKIRNEMIREKEAGVKWECLKHKYCSKNNEE